MKQLTILLPALIVGAVFWSPVSAHADDAPPAHQPGDVTYTNDYWSIVSFCEDAGPEYVEGWLVVTSAADFISYDELGSEVWTDWYPAGQHLEVQPWAIDCPYTLGDDPNLYTEGEETAPEPVPSDAPDPIVVDAPIDAATTGGTVWKVGLAVVAKAL